MHPSLRPLLLATGALLLSAQNAAAQFIELVTEARVTLQVTLTKNSVASTATDRKTTSSTIRLVNTDVINELRGANVIPAQPPDGWDLVAVRAAPADLAFVDAGFHLYAVNGSQRIRIPSGKFSSDAFGSAAKYRERHLGQYILDSSGTVTNHVAYSYKPTLGGLAVTQSDTDGFATIAFRTANQADGFEILFYSISSLRATTRGSFSADTGQGLMTINLTLGAAKLVPASNYPDVDFYTSESSAD